MTGETGGSDCLFMRKSRSKDSAKRIGSTEKAHCHDTAPGGKVAEERGGLMNETVTVDIPYTVDTGEKLVNETFGPNNIRRRKTGAHELKRVVLRNGRLLAGQLSLDEQGFVFVEHKTKVTDFFDATQLEWVYYPEVEQLIKSASGASRVVIFDHTLRSGDETEGEEKLIREAV